VFQLGNIGWRRLVCNPSRDPLVLDLDGDGIELVSVRQSTAQFDLEGNNFALQELVIF
jgi:hypothetical protein